jgi:hypothetical protein
MLPEVNFKKAAILVALDLSLKRMRKSPERCSRNLMELGLTAYPDKLSKKEQSDFSQELLTACKSGDIAVTRELFIMKFF